MPKQTKPPQLIPIGAGITGRDGMIIAQAVATAYAMIGYLPEQCQEWSNWVDMGVVLKNLYNNHPDWLQHAREDRHIISELEWRGKREDRLPFKDPFVEDRKTGEAMGIETEPGGATSIDEWDAQIKALRDKDK